MDLQDVEYQLSKAKLLGSKGTTGTQASFLELFDGDYAKVRELDRKIAEKMGYPGCFAVSGQTYSRKLDSQMLAVLSGVAQKRGRNSRMISGCCSTSRRWRSRLKRIRLVLLLWRTSATPCARSAWLPLRAM